MENPIVLELSNLEWRVRAYAPNEAAFQNAWTSEPNPALEMPATVPGDVVSDAIRAEGGPHPYRDLESRRYEWTAQRDWLYRVEFDCPQLDGRRAQLRFGAVDYRCEVHLNGRRVGGHQGASDAFAFDVTDHLRPGANRLQVLVRFAEPEPGQLGRTSEVRTWKPRFAYGWDWNCRLIPLGIWQPVTLLLHQGLWVEDPWWRSILADDHSRADVAVLGTVHSDARRRARVTAEIRDPKTGRVVASGTAPALLAAGATEVQVPFSLEAPELWWPNGYGEAFLYDAALRIEADGLTPVEAPLRIGVRDLHWERTEGAPEDSLPYTPVVNGRRIHIRGFNWAPPDNLHAGALPKYRRSVELAKECRTNLLRVWGGAHVPPPEFFEACDECGVLVWQEFCQSSSGIDNEPPKDDAYIRMATREARGIVRRLRGCTCLAAWCGGNELTDSGYTPLTCAHPALEALRAVAEELDPGRLYLPTSPSGPLFGPAPDQPGRMHDIHGPWLYDGPTAHYALWDGVDALFHSEMGAPGAANPETLRRWISEERIWPPDETNPIWMHHGAWWVNRALVERLFGPMGEGDIDRFVVASQHLHAEALRYAVEAARRRKWRCAGTVIWQFNEAFPNTSCTNVLDFDLRPKPAFSAVRDAHAPLHPCARYAGLDWAGKSAFEAGVYVCGGLPEPGECVVRAEVLDLDGAVRHTREEMVRVGEPQARHAFDVSWPLGDLGVFVLRVSALAGEGAAPLTTDAMLSAQPAPLFGGVFDLPPVPLSVRAGPAGTVVRNEGTRLALPVLVAVEDADGAARVAECNLFALLPGEERRVFGPEPGARVSVRGFNVEVATAGS